MENENSAAARKREATARTANGVLKAWENRTALVKQMAQDERTATDAKTAKLRALRLAKEKEDAEAAAQAPAPAPVAKKRAAKTVR